MPDLSLVYVLWGALLLAPPLGVAAGVTLHRASPRRARAVYAATATLVAAAAALAWSPWSLRGTVADGWLLGIAYATYCAGAAAFVLRCRRRWVSITTGVFAAAPVVVGYLLGTVGGLGLVFVAADYVPDSERDLAPGLLYRMYSFGNATTDFGGAVIAVYSRPRWAPFLERRLFRGEYDFRQHELASLAVRAVPQPGATLVEVRDGDRVLDRVRGP